LSACRHPYLLGLIVTTFVVLSNIAFSDHVFIPTAHTPPQHIQTEITLTNNGIYHTSNIKYSNVYILVLDGPSSRLIIKKVRIFIKSMPTFGIDVDADIHMV
jgi:hypothetical protein